MHEDNTRPFPTSPDPRPWTPGRQLGVLALGVLGALALLPLAAWVQATGWLGAGGSLEGGMRGLVAGVLGTCALLALGAAGRLAGRTLQARREFAVLTRDAVGLGTMLVLWVLFRMLAVPRWRAFELPAVLGENFEYLLVLAFVAFWVLALARQARRACALLWQVLRN